jgi:hypothetical protein
MNFMWAASTTTLLRFLMGICPMANMKQPQQSSKAWRGKTKARRSKIIIIFSTRQKSLRVQRGEKCVQITVRQCRVVIISDHLVIEAFCCLTNRTAVADISCVRFLIFVEMRC